MQVFPVQQVLYTELKVHPGLKKYTSDQTQKIIQAVSVHFGGKSFYPNDISSNIKTVITNNCTLFSGCKISPEISKLADELLLVLSAIGVSPKRRGDL